VLRRPNDNDDKNHLIINIITSVMAHEESNAREGVGCIGTMFV
jgi:hypothetical protein